MAIASLLSTEKVENEDIYDINIATVQISSLCVLNLTCTHSECERGLYSYSYSVVITELRFELIFIQYQVCQFCLKQLSVS